MHTDVAGVLLCPRHRVNDRLGVETCATLTLLAKDDMNGVRRYVGTLSDGHVDGLLAQFDVDQV
jgi:hypothetical protein